MKPYRILVVDDSPFMRKIITDLIEQDSSFWVERTAANGSEALRLIQELSPDLVTMDIEMPEMNGLEALGSIMKEHPLPVIMLSGINEQGMHETIMALELGAFDFIRKPSISGSSQSIEEIGRTLRMQIQTAMASRERREALKKKTEEQGALPKPFPAGTGLPAASLPAPRLTGAGKPEPPPLARRGGKPAALPVPASRAAAPLAAPAARKRPGEQKPAPAQRGAGAGSGAAVPRAAGQKQVPAVRGTYEHIVAVGCSTGGPKALKVLLEAIPADFPAPIVIVQHMPPNFTKSLAQRLHSLSPLTVVEAEQGMVLERGTAYIAPGGRHMRVVPAAEGSCRIELDDGELRSGHRPSVDVLFESLLPFSGLQRHTVLLTGMGADGAKAMKKLYVAGITSTFAESEETCVVYGMPRSAVELGCVSSLLPLPEIAPKLVRIVK